jgi:glycine oxidase
MMLLKVASGQETFSHNLHHRGRYAVARGDGLVLVGSTVENAGFDKSTTVAGIVELSTWAATMGLGTLRLQKSWAGLRPGTPDGLPLLGRMPGYENWWVASGHGRSGIQLAPATALVMSDLILGQAPSLDVRPFDVNRLLG